MKDEEERAGRNLATEAMPKRSRSWGGRREGAGRKPERVDPVRTTTVLDGPDFDRVEAIAERRGSTVAAVIRDAVRAFLRRQKEV